MQRHRSPFRVSAVLVKDGQILVIHRKKNSKEYFILVGGTPEERETHEQTLIRETKEETNLDIKPIKKLGEVYNDFDGRMHFFYLAEIIGGELVHPGRLSSYTSYTRTYSCSNPLCLLAFIR